VITKRSKLKQFLEYGNAKFIHGVVCDLRTVEVTPIANTAQTQNGLTFKSRSTQQYMYIMDLSAGCTNVTFPPPK